MLTKADTYLWNAPSGRRSALLLTHTTIVQIVLFRMLLVNHCSSLTHDHDISLANLLPVWCVWA
jgi:hypothetical protein